ncbi:phosphate/phosphite/phosphonate ABC transporter substrate-binding protein [Actinokineospora sp. UTMC 2448]|uniref:phosphate/phosphite/phosphonate ABC transporter substrate-binding protein n=1 Tax=Actinokineospora sp. UTMC 2448 TaxID=2268449 RepID=UPI002164D73E|nr:phosphate/phosphite/phosphonate ABC transporter substrate-binding protein [Actinokineospora sp. UTMC 2448]UVS79650.1 Phosphate-import protein PhnD precursor [Actinokineospora sp. UTMC 2448]
MKRTAILIAALLALTACGGTDPAADSPTCPNGEIRFGIEPYEDPAKLTPAYGVLTGALQRELNCPVRLQVVHDYSAEVLAMQNGKLELAQFGPLGYVFASERAQAEPLVSFGDANGRLTSYQAGIWVPVDSPVKSLADLRGRSLALSEPGSTSGDALPRYALSKAGLGRDEVKIDYAGGHPEAVLALINGKVDAAEINTQQLATASAAGTFDPAGFRQVWASDPIPNDPITVAGALDPAFKTAVRDALLRLTPQEIAQVGALLDVDPPGPMVAVDRATYQPLFDLAAELGLTEGDV